MAQGPRLCNTNRMRKLQGPFLILGGTGSLGTKLVEELLPLGEVVAFSRDEEKHHQLRRAYPTVRTILGDVRDYRSVLHALNAVEPRVVINAAAMKQIPLCEDSPYQALLTNTVGAHNLVEAVREHGRTRRGTLRVLSVSTDKACKPVNAYGMTKALQERIHLQANNPPFAVHTCVRYGNVLESTGSVIPLFKDKIARGEPLTITDPSMTRFLLSLGEATELIMQALHDEQGGAIYVPKVRSTTVGALADALIRASRKRVKKVLVGARPGEKIHEILVSEEELSRTEDRGTHLVIHPAGSGRTFANLTAEYSSEPNPLGAEQVDEFLRLRSVVAPESKKGGKGRRVRAR